MSPITSISNVNLQNKTIDLVHTVRPDTQNKYFVVTVFPLTDKIIFDNRLKNTDDLKNYLDSVLSQPGLGTEPFVPLAGDFNRFFFRQIIGTPIGSNFSIHITINSPDNSLDSSIYAVLYTFRQIIGNDITTPRDVLTIGGQLKYNVLIACNKKAMPTIDLPAIPIARANVLPSIRLLSDYVFAKDSMFLLKMPGNDGYDTYSVLFCDDACLVEENENALTAFSKNIIRIFNGRKNNTRHIYEWKILKPIGNQTIDLKAYGLSALKYN